MLLCSQCDLEYPAGKKFCRKCGSALTDEREAHHSRCPSCGVAIVLGKKFCKWCGQRLETMPACPGCGQPNLPGKKFCTNCGQPLMLPQSVSDDAPELKTAVSTVDGGSAVGAAPALAPTREVIEAAPSMPDTPAEFGQERAARDIGSVLAPEEKTTMVEGGAEVGRVLGAIFESTKESEMPSKPQPVESAHTQTQPTSTRRKKFYLWGGAVLTAAAALAAWLLFFSTESRMMRAVDRGDLVTPAGTSAYDYYKRLRPQGISGGTRTELLQQALPKLNSTGETLLQKRVEAVNFKESELAELGLIYEWAAELSPEDTKIAARNHYAQGIATLIEGKHREALKHFQRSTELDANWAPAYNDLGRTYVKLGDGIHAEQSYKKAIEINPSWVFPQLNLGGVYFLRKDFGAAEQTYLRATQFDGTLATPWYFLGQVYEGEKRYVEAIGAYERAIQLAASRPSSAFTADGAQKRIERIKQKMANAGAD